MYVHFLWWGGGGLKEMNFNNDVLFELHFQNLFRYLQKVGWQGIPGAGGRQLFKISPDWLR